MAYGGGIFVPSETAYKDPNRFRDVLQAEGNKEATYLSQMDQFYAQLDEMKREFDITSEQKDRFFEENLAFEREKLDWTSEENELNRALERWKTDQTVGVQRDILSLEGAKFGETQRNNAFIRDLTMSRENRTQGAYDLYANTLNQIYGSGFSSGNNSVGGVQLLTPGTPEAPNANILDYSNSGISGIDYSSYAYNDYDPSDWADTLW